MRLLPPISLLLAAAGLAQQPGVITEKLACARQPDQTYALYLPSRYTPERTWPIVLCFEPGARALYCAQVFEQAAETRGYVVMASWNSRNGNWNTSLDAARALLEEAQTRYRIDPKRIYLSGFSGGARVAFLIAAQAKFVAGVIAAGAGFPNGADPAAAFPAPVFLTAAIEDFNHAEVQQVSRHLDKLGTPWRAAFHPGRHSWPPAEVVDEALAWLDLQAMRTGSLPKDEARIAAFRDRPAAGASPVAEYRRAAQLVKDLRGLADIAALEARAKELSQNKEVRAALREEHSEEDRYFEAAAAFYEQRDDLAALRRLIQKWTNKANLAADTSERRVARRVLHGEFAHLVESRFELVPKKKYAEFAARLEVAATILPPRPGAWFELAQIRALQGETGPALDALDRAITEGFRDRAAVLRSRELDSVRQEARYAALLARIP